MKEGRNSTEYEDERERRWGGKVKNNRSGRSCTKVNFTSPVLLCQLPEGLAATTKVCKQRRCPHSVDAKRRHCLEIYCGHIL